MDEKIKLKDLIQDSTVHIRLPYDEAEKMFQLVFPYTEAPFVSRDIRYVYTKWCMMLDIQMHRYKKCPAEQREGFCPLSDNMEAFKNEYLKESQKDINPI